MQQQIIDAKADHIYFLIQMNHRIKKVNDDIDMTVWKYY